MGDGQNQEGREKKPHLKLRDLKLTSKDAHVVGGASKPQAHLRDLTASRDIHITRDSGKSGK